MEETNGKSDLLVKKNSLGEWLDSPEAIKLRKAFHAFQEQEEAEDQAWWDSLDYKSKAQSFRQICKLMHQSDVIDRGSYRWAMYDVFDLDYGDGLNHYMELHNIISRGLDSQNNIDEKKERMTDVTMDDKEEHDTSKDVPSSSFPLKTKENQR